MGGRGVDLSIIANRRFKQITEPYTMSINNQEIHVETIGPVPGNNSLSPLRSFTSDAYRIKNREGEYAQIILFNPPIEENGIRSRPRKVSYEWDNNAGKGNDCPPRTVHKHFWENDVKDPEHRAVTPAERDALKLYAGFPADVKYKVETKDGYVIE